MKFLPLLVLLLLLPPALRAQNAGGENEAGSPEDNYVAGPDSKAQPGVPVGTTFDFTLDHSTIFPGTKRTITVYVPQQYTGEQPACVFVALDTLGWRAPVVFDNLIHKKQMPVTIGIGVAPGQVPSAAPPDNPRHNRSYEFDSLDDRLARFLVEEVLPAVQRQKTADGRVLKLSADPNDRAIGGGSTGAIAAFTVAWQRPDQFRRVFTSIGTFVGMRGGDHYPVLVRKTEPKPLRVFMQDGSNDQWRNGYQMGDWWTANQTMEKALSWAGYDVTHHWGTGFHTSKHAKAIFPDVMRWLWRDWPAPILPPVPAHPILREILQPGEDWKLVGQKFSGPLAVDQQGNLIAPQEAKAMRSSHLPPAVRISGLVLRHDGSLYAADPAAGKIWFIAADGKARIVDEQFARGNTVALTPDERWLFAGGEGARVGYSYQVQADGGLPYKEPYFDRNGRVTAILPSPDARPVNGIAFGGADFSTLYLSTATGVYARLMKARGLAPGAAPLVLPPAGQG